MKEDQPNRANSPDREPTHLTRGRLLARNTVLSFLGQGAPMVVALISIPLLIQGLGTDRFGVLTVAWMVIGYFGLFDLGLSRALTQVIAERLGVGRREEIPALAWTALSVVALFGAIGAVILALISPWLVTSGLRVPEALQPETLKVFYLLALSLPWIASTAALRGVLEAQQRFDLVNAVRVPSGIFNYLAPLAVSPFSASLVPVVAVLAVGRVVAWAVHLWLCLRTLPELRGGFRLQRAMIRPLLRFGSWLTVSNVISPLMVYLDRFLIGAMISMAAVAYYVTPYEVITKLWLVPTAFLAVLFPAFATSFGFDRDRTALLFDRGVRATFLLIFPAALVVVTLAQEGLDLWLGAEFANQGTRVLQWLAVGVFLNSVGQVPSALLQSVGRPDITGKLHLVELPLYTAALWWLLRRYGIEGAALAWTARVALDTIVLLAMAVRLLPASRYFPAFRALLLGTPLLLLFAFVVAELGLAIKLAILVAALLLFAMLAWYRVLTVEERALVRSHWRLRDRTGSLASRAS